MADPFFVLSVSGGGWGHRQNSYQQAVGNLSPERDQRGKTMGKVERQKRFIGTTYIENALLAENCKKFLE